MENITFGPVVSVGAQINRAKIKVLDTSSFVYEYYEINDLYPYLIPGSISSNNTITMGSSTSFGTQGTTNLDIDKLNSNYLVTLYNETSRIVNISNNNIAASNQNSTGLSSIYLRINVIDPTKLIVIYTKNNTDYYAYSRIGTIASSAYTTLNSEFVITNNKAANNIEISLLDSTHFVVIYTNGANIYSKIGTISDTSITYGSEYLVCTNGSYATVKTLNSTQFIVSFSNSAISENAALIIGTVSNDNQVTSGNIYTSNIRTRSGKICVMDSSRVILISGNPSNYDNTATLCSIYNGAITFDTPILLNNAAYTAFAVDKIDATRFIATYQDGNILPKLVVGTIPILGKKINGLTYIKWNDIPIVKWNNQ